MNFTGKPKGILVKLTNEDHSGRMKQMKRAGYHHVALRAKDFDKTIRFYETIGCTVLRSWGEGDKRACMLDVGGNNILEVFAGGADVPEDKPHFEHIALRSEDVPGDFQNALAAGARPRMEPGEANLGGNYPIAMAFVYGPNDEVIEFFREK